MPKRLALIFLAMACAFCIALGVLHYAKTHPIADERTHERAPQ